MFQILVFSFIAIPILEIYLLFQVGEIIGGGWTILTVIFTAILGAGLLRHQGLSTLTRLNQSVAQGQLPPTILVEGILLLLAGALLLTPGFFTDGVGFFLLFPPTRKSLAQALLKRGMFVAMGGMHSGMDQAGPTNAPRHHSPGSGDGQGSHSNVIEGEYERKDEK